MNSKAADTSVPVHVHCARSAIASSIDLIRELYGRTPLVRSGALDFTADVAASSSVGVQPPSTPFSLPPKSFFSAPLESLPARCSKDEFAARASLFLARKLLPAPAPSTSKYLQNMSRPRSAFNEEFVSSAITEIGYLFKDGWDKSYSERCARMTLPLTSCIENSRADGGARFYGVDKWSRDEWVGMARGEIDFEIPRERKVCKVVEKGKCRIVTVQPVLSHCLRPLHDLLYDTLSGCDWLLRGEPSTRVMNKFRRTAGEVVVSGDYESATDNFNMEHSTAILKAILDRAPNVPEVIKREALRSMSCVLVTKNASVEQRCGQLMGNFLSFPLLCLTNRLILVHAFGHKRLRTMPVFINGDDIVFRCSPEEYRVWVCAVKQAGLVLSEGKTLRHDRYFSINSTFFMADEKGASLVPVFRASTNFGPLDKEDATMSLIGRAKSCAWGFHGKRRRIVWHAFIRAHYRAFKGLAGSMLANGIRFDERVLREAGLWAKEKQSYYIARRPSYKLRSSGTIPEHFSWRQKSVVPFSVQSLSQESWSRYCRDRAWEIGDDVLDSPTLEVLAPVCTVSRRTFLSKQFLGNFGFQAANPDRSPMGPWGRGVPAAEGGLREFRRDVSECWRRAWKRKPVERVVVDSREVEWRKGVEWSRSENECGWRRAKMSDDDENRVKEWMTEDLPNWRRSYRSIKRVDAEDCPVVVKPFVARNRTTFESIGLGQLYRSWSQRSPLR